MRGLVLTVRRVTPLKLQPSLPPEPLGLAIWRSSLEGSFLAVEAGSVLALRTLSMAGMRPMAADEPLRMWVEKPPAFAAAGLAAWLAVLSGQRADQVLAAAIRPLRSEASANALRLAAVR